MQQISIMNLSNHLKLKEGKNKDNICDRQNEGTILSSFIHQCNRVYEFLVDFDFCKRVGILLGQNKTIFSLGENYLHVNNLKVF